MGGRGDAIGADTDRDTRGGGALVEGEDKFEGGNEEEGLELLLLLLFGAADLGLAPVIAAGAGAETSDVRGEDMAHGGSAGA